MNKTLLLVGSLFSILSLNAADHNCCKNDSVEMLAYAKINGEGGLHLAWRTNETQQWEPISNFSWINSDFGEWGKLKKMYAPVLEYKDSIWTLSWIADMDGMVVANATSPDLIAWSPQKYAMGTMHQGSSQYAMPNMAVQGNILRVPGCLVKKLKQYATERSEKDALYSETMSQDPERFAELLAYGSPALTYTLTANPKGAKPISDKLIGIFFEDINYAADGGLYGELIQNRDFEYNPADRKGDMDWNAMTAWKVYGKNLGKHEIMNENPLHPNNPNYLRLTAKPGMMVSNEGWDGIPVQADSTYRFSMYARGNAKVLIALAEGDANNGTLLASEELTIESSDWKKYDLKLIPNASANNAKLNILVLKGKDKNPVQFDIDMVSLFPKHTYKERLNGMRADLTQKLADLHPKFVRFPGGCVAHGDGIDNIYDWKGSVGPLYSRKPLRNLWGYHQTRGLGYYEYFQLCEDIGAEPLPVLAAGVPCQNSGSPAHHSHDALTSHGQQCGIPMEEMDNYIQDILDLIEWANGPADSKWGAVRAEAGHPEPFNLKYLGIGNEDMITEVFEERFRMIYDAVRKAHPEIEIVGTVGPFFEGTDYVAGWELARELEIPYVDEHYYVSPGWLIYNQDYYDDYERGGTQVYLGEYASHLAGRPSNLEAALSDAIYLTSVERNADVVAMTSYAPLFSKDNHTQWRPDLIYFNNTRINPSVDYYVQLMYGQNSGQSYIPAQAQLDSDNPKAKVRVSHSIVKDKETGDYILKLANLLPVPVEAKADLSKLKLNNKKALTATVLSGKPTDTNLVPKTRSVQPASKGVLSYSMPPYSFTVIRIPSK